MRIVTFSEATEELAASLFRIGKRKLSEGLHKNTTGKGKR
jgi:hypothetical protein